jgi:putative FmdB family regulatory protein
MPRYEFLCKACGSFERRRDHRESGEPMLCPSCNAIAKRVYSMPGVTVTSKAGNKARLLDEQGSEAGLVKRPQAQEPAPPPRPQRVGGRPWQVSH